VNGPFSIDDARENIDEVVREKRSIEKLLVP
jgi:hypothetical protein